MAPTNFWLKWPYLRQRLENARHRCFIFDVDGTLSPIVKDPDQARVPISVRRQIQRLSRGAGTTVGILSGRSVSKVQQMVGIPHIIYGGNHGLEIIGQGRPFIHPVARKNRFAIKKIEQLIKIAFPNIRGLIVENKGLSLSVHYRCLNLVDRAKFNRRFSSFLKKRNISKYVIVRRGKCVWELLPHLSWDKGSALKKIVAGGPANSMVLFAGDDRTDQAAFCALKKRDIGIQIGRTRNTRATYYLRNQNEMKRLLNNLIQL